MVFGRVGTLRSSRVQRHIPNQGLTTALTNHRFQAAKGVESVADLDKQAAPSSRSEREALRTSPAEVQFKKTVAQMSVPEQLQALQPPRPFGCAPLQSKSTSDGSADEVHATAAQGVIGSGQKLPHLDSIQQSFGKQDVSNVQAYLGGPAIDANQALGASAYATGDKVAFKGTPSLHTAAHETAHVVQQRAGVQLSGGVGQPGDQYEQQADRIANRVVRGESAKDLIAEVAGIDTTPRAVQRQVQREDGPSKSEMVGFIADKVANPADSSLRQAYEAGVRALSSRAEAGAQAVGINLQAYNNAKLSNRDNPVHLSSADDTKLDPLARELNAARMQLSTDTKMLTLRPLLHFIFFKNLARYRNKYGATYDFLRNEERKTNAQVCGGACRPNPDINRFLSDFRDWLNTKTLEEIQGYYADAQTNRLGE